MTIIAAADGSALGNPGPAGWGWYVDDDCWAVGGWAHGTNNKAELTAVLDLLQQTAHLADDLLVYCDSTYVINSVTKWMAGWKRRGWKKGDGKAVLNVEIMQALDAAMVGRRVRFAWVKGHSGHELNEAADRLANGAAAAWKTGDGPGARPGLRRLHGAAPASAPGRSRTSPTCSRSRPAPTAAIAWSRRVESRAPGLVGPGLLGHLEAGERAGGQRGGAYVGTAAAVAAGEPHGHQGGEDLHPPAAPFQDAGPDGRLVAQHHLQGP